MMRRVIQISSLFSFLSLATASPTIWERSRWGPCPAPCGLTGPSPEDWGVYYYDMNAINLCERPMLLDFMVDAPLNQSGTHTKVRACSIWGNTIPTLNNTDVGEPQPSDATLQRLELLENTGESRLVARGVYHIQNYLNKYVGSDTNIIRFAKIGRATLGFFGGGDIDVARTSDAILSTLVQFITVNEVSHGVVEQVCGAGRTARGTWGIAVAFDDTFSTVQDAVKAWAHGQCVTLGSNPSNYQLLSVASASVSSASQVYSRNVTIYTPSDKVERSAPTSHLQRRADCRTIQVEFGDGCGSLATKCGINGAEFTEYNDKEGLCSSLIPGQHVCCSSGTLPSFRPEPNEDGTCASYIVKEDDSCQGLAARYDLTQDDLDDFNQNTWGWNGCKQVLWVGTNMCLSAGRPPMPEPVANAICGPQVPGTEQPTDDTDLVDLNPCPLNACCNIWGQCGITAEFCTVSESASGAPGTAAPGENGCISNCGTDIVKSDPPESFIRIGYFQGYNLDRDCQNMDAQQIDTDKYTHIHFGFGVMDENFDVTVGDDRTWFEFEQFKSISGAKRILSMGGWAFSTEPDTYMIFRNGVQPANREVMAQRIADFVLEHDLDGIDIDWEYPGAPDIPGIPPGSENEGRLYAVFLALLKSKLPGKSISIAVPASYWYLKPFPIKEMHSILDYFVFMAYDLHGQWNFANQWAASGCPEGNCLRSHVNLTETHNALSMITKAGAPSHKVIVGVASYGRAFKMASAGCTGPECTFTGSASGARKGRCTDEAGYISYGEIKEILEENPNSRTFVDDSFSNILVYDDTEWVAYSDDNNRGQRETVYKGLNMGGSVEWAVDLQSFHSVPSGAVMVVNGKSEPITNWRALKAQVDLGNDPYTWGNRTGTWTDYDCQHIAVEGKLQMPPEERWDELGCDDAWDDAIRTWKKDYESNDYTFSEAIFDFFNAEEQECGLGTEEADCGDAISCNQAQGKGSGPAGWEILNSLIKINSMFSDYYTALKDASEWVNREANVDDFVSTFAPVQDYTTAFNVLMDILGIVVPSAMAPAFNSIMRNTHYFTAHPSRLDTAKDISYTLVAGWVNLAKDTNPSDYGWNEDDAGEFQLHMSKTFDLWEASTDLAAQELFNGTDTAIASLAMAIKDGQMIDGLIPSDSERLPRYSRKEMQELIQSSFYSYMIPQIWQESGQSVFWLDPGDQKCDDDSNPVSDYIFDTTAEITKACYEGKAYYLVYPEGSASNTCQTPGGGQGVCRPYKFDAPSGVESTGSYFASIDDMLASSIRSYNNNGGKNGWDLKDMSSLDEDGLRKGRFIEEEFRAAGRNRIPICSAEEAFFNWGYNYDGHYPCN